MNYILSILMCTIPKRIDLFNALSQRIMNQIQNLPENSGQVEFLYDNDVEISTGTKRNRLLEKANGLFVVFVDDDDDISDDYVSSIVNVINLDTDVDCIGIQGIITTNGREQMQWYIGLEYGSWYERENIYYRTPNHISPIKRELALFVNGFPEISFKEDWEFSMKILPHLKTQNKVQHNIYHYKYLTTK